MAAKIAGRSPRPVPPGRIRKLERDLLACSARVSELERAVDTHIQRMAAMQAEIDHLRASLKGRA